MKILEIIPSLGSGGGERFVVDLCNELVAQGHDVKLVVLNSLLDSDSNFYIGELTDSVELVSMNKKPGFDVHAIHNIRKVIKEFSPDVVHTHLNAIAYVIAGGSSAKYFHTIHSDAKYEAEGKLSTLIRKVLFKSKRVVPVTISNQSHNSFQSFYGIDAPMILNGRNVSATINTSRVRNELQSLGVDMNSPIICNIAHLSRNKRQGLIARVSKRLENEGYTFSMLLVGRCVHDDILQEINAANCKYVHILGEKSNPLEFLALSNGFCLMSAVEGMPISLIEALGCGAIPICTPVGGIADVVSDGDTGFLSDDISEEACYRALKRFLDTPEQQLALMKNRIKEEYSKYSIQTCAINYVSLFNQYVGLK